MMMMMRSLYLTSTFSMSFTLLAHWNNSPPVDMLLYWDTLSWCQANKVFFVLLFNAACSTDREATTTNCIVFYLNRPVLEPMIYRTRKDSHENAVK
jgi:hypothetical protein